MRNIILFLLLVFFISSCASKKDIIYYQDIDTTNLERLDAIKPKIEIQLNDIVQVNIQTLSPSAAIPFNKNAGVGINAGGGGGGGQQNGMLLLQGYIVDNDGFIQIPFAGKVKIFGLSLEQAEIKIKEKLASFLKDPYVSVRILNYKFTIQGEVNSPGTYETQDPNLTLLQALGMAGDLTINGKRDNIMIIRTLGNERIIRKIDITKSDWMNTPYFYVKQNDIIYVEPNNPKVKTAGFIGNVGTLLSAISFMTSIALIIISTR